MNWSGKFEYGWNPCSYGIKLKDESEWFEKKEKCFKNTLVSLKNVQYCKKFDEI